MATQICPNCKEDSFIWTTDEDVNGIKYTTWSCLCGYLAYEDESLEKHCTYCKTFTEMRLEDNEKKYWWCSNCNKIEVIELKK
ncbi:MAG: hypothetical protein Q8K02_06915 [Flavobacterium sp.]|nr:hypothetical protein [Flavobacterium sp.]